MRSLESQTSGSNVGFFSELGDRVVGAPSILSANFAHLARDVQRARDGGAELIHFDVMDNHFVPNLTVGPAVAASLTVATELPINVHLQVSYPDNLIPAFAESRVQSIAVQPEVVTHLHRTLELIRACGCEAGIALAPSTPPEKIRWALPYLDFIIVMSVDLGFGGQSFIPEMTEKVRVLRESSDVPIAVDGGIDAESAPVMVEAGARVLIAGSAVYKGEPAEEMEKIITAGRDALA